jgi:hypothetical protein
LGAADGDGRRPLVRAARIAAADGLPIATVAQLGVVAGKATSIEVVLKLS